MSRICRWCRELLSPTLRADAEFCSKQHRQAAWRLRGRHTIAARQGRPMVFAYADPPYPGRAQRYYRMPEVDHVELIARLEVLAPDGWALSTAADALRQVLPLCPDGARVCPWVKPGPPAKNTHGLHNGWEPLIVVRGRQRQPGKRDWLLAQPARHGGELPGRKPLSFCAWLFECLGMVPGDQLIDLYPGTEIVSRAWDELSRAEADDGSEASPRAAGDTSRRYLGDLSLGAPSDTGLSLACDASAQSFGDTSPGAGKDSR